MRCLEVTIERWPIAGTFTIARGSRTEAVVVVATVHDDAHAGAAECVPYARYGESVDSVAAQLRGLGEAVAEGLTREELAHALPPGAARNALDCALWDLEARRSGRPLYEIAGTPRPGPMLTAYTISLGVPAAMAEAARRAADRPLLKIKLGADGDPERLAAVREGAPAARLIVDANEGWRRDNLADNLAACERAGVELIEQPLPAGDDEALAHIETPIAICADESIHDAASLDDLPPWYTAINIKLDKTGGLTDALVLLREASARDLGIMVGCMVGTSLGMTPALIVAEGADWVDLDGPLLLARDRDGGLRYEGSTLIPPWA
ncbi:N-acetyl-D-Glu racemase DgcA [Pseudochelatococcus sp. B33]